MKPKGFRRFLRAWGYAWVLIGLAVVVVFTVLAVPTVLFLALRTITGNLEITVGITAVVLVSIVAAVFLMDNPDL